MLIKNKIFNLTERAQKAYAETVETYNCNEMIPLKSEEIRWVEGQLEVCFSDDFVAINQIFDYEYIGGFEFYTLYYQGVSGVIEETIGNRKALNLPHRYVMLSDMGDGGSVLLETQDSPEKPSPVIWCGYEDLHYMCDNGNFVYNPTIWPSFTDFFEYLVEQEEESLQKGKV